AAGERSAPVRRKGAARRDALAILGPRALGSYLRRIPARKRRQIPRAQERRARCGGDCQGHRVVPSRRASLGRTAQRQKLCCWQQADSCCLLVWGSANPRGEGSYPGRAVPRNQTLVRDLARIAGLAEDTGAMRPAGRRRGLRLRRVIALKRLKLTDCLDG